MVHRLAPTGKGSAGETGFVSREKPRFITEDQSGVYENLTFYYAGLYSGES